jgi:hypothetical protein
MGFAIRGRVDAQAFQHEITGNQKASLTRKEIYRSKLVVNQARRFDRVPVERRSADEVIE